MVPDFPNQAPQELGGDEVAVAGDDHRSDDETDETDEEAMGGDDANGERDHVAPFHREVEAQGGQGSWNLGVVVEVRHCGQGTDGEFCHARPNLFAGEVIGFPMRPGTTSS